MSDTKSSIPLSSNGKEIEPARPHSPVDLAGPRILIACLLLIAATLAFYNPVIHNQFISFDDGSYIVNNAQVQSGLTWDTVKWSFTTFQEGNWHPLTWLSHALDCQIFRLNPVGHHYANLLFHTANAVLLFLLLWRATGSVWLSFAVAAIFALHPLNVESVVWASERKNVLSMFFFLLALHAYDQYGRTGRRSLYVGLILLFVLGLMAKPQIVTLPFVLLLWDYWPLQRIRGHYAVNGGAVSSAPRSLKFLIWEKLPLFLLAAADSVVTVIAQRAGNAVRSVSESSVPLRFENAIASYVRYIGKLFWPSRLAPMYPRPVGLLPLWEVAGSAAILVGISALVFYWRKQSYLVMGWLWFLGTLVPMIGIITVGEQSMADRYAYLPSIGLFIAVIWTLDALANVNRIGKVWRVAGVFLALAVLGCLTYRQVGFWRDDDTLWHYTLSVTKGNYMAHNNLALMFAKSGRSNEAVAEFEAATALHQYPPGQVLLLAQYELRVGRPTEALEECDSVLRVTSEAKFQTVAWAEIGLARLLLHHYDQAADAYQNALRLNAENEMALVGSGVLSLRNGQHGVAVNQLSHAVKIDSSDINLLLQAQAFKEAGRFADADSTSLQARKISSDLTSAQNAANQLLLNAGLSPI